MKTTGIIGLMFKPGVPEKVIERTISKIYKDNEDVIAGMSYREFRDEKTLPAVMKLIDNDQIDIIHVMGMQNTTLEAFGSDQDELQNRVEIVDIKKKRLVLD